MKAMMIVQEGQFSLETLRHLQSRVQAAHKSNFPHAQLTVFWNVMPRGCAMTNYQLSQSSLASIQVPNGTHKQQRADFLKDCFDAWRDITGQHPDHIMVSAIDTDVFKLLLTSNLERLSLLGKARFIIATLWRLIQSTYRHRLLISSFT